MLTPDHPRRRSRGLAAAMVMAAMLLVPASATMAMDAGSAELPPSGPEMTDVQATVDELRTLVDDLSLANDALAADNASLQQTVDSLAVGARPAAGVAAPLRRALRAARGRPPAALRAAQGPAGDATRGRGSARAHPRPGALLGPGPPGPAGRSRDETAPAFLDWRFGEFSTTQEFSSAYVDTGANAFDTSMEEFRSEVLLSVANRLDGLLTILDRAR